MAEYGDYQSAGQAASFPRNSHYSQHSVAPSTQSWSNSNRRSAPLPQPVNLPTPVQAVRPLPTPNRGSYAPSTGPLRVINNPPEPPTAQIDHILRRNNTYDTDSGTATSGTPKTRALWSTSSSGGRPRPQKKKSFVGGFFKGVKKLPRTMFGYGAGMGGSQKSKLKYSDTSTMEDTSASEITSNTPLPAYSSVPPSPAVRAPTRSRLNMQHVGDMIPVEPTIPESPLPEVVRLESQRNSRNSIIPSLKVTPPSGSYGENANFYSEPEYQDYPQNPGHEFAAESHSDRATVMVYNDSGSYYYDHNRPAPTPLRRQVSTSPALSYVEEHPEHPPSLHSSAAPSTVRDARAPVDATQVIASEPGTRLSYASPTPYHAASQSVPIGALQLSSAPTAQSLPQSQTSHHSQINQAPPIASPPPQDVGSPMSVHPEPTNDYRKMTLSPSPTSHETYATATSYYDPSFSSLNPVEKFFKMLYNLPWVSHDRVTVDYLPGEGASKARKRRSRPMSSWYHGMMGHSRRSSATLDLLSSGSPSSLGTSLRASLAIPFGSPRSPRSGQPKQPSDRQKSRHHRSRHHQSSSRHHHRRRAEDSRRRKRDTGTSMGTTNTDANHHHHHKKSSASPLIPSIYPYHYPPYPYPAFSTFPVPAPAPPIASQPSQSSAQRATSPRGPRGAAQQPMMYAAPSAYSPYQPLMGAPQVYLLSPAQGQAAKLNVPASLVPGHGGSHDGHAHSPTAQQLSELQKGEQGQRQPTPGVPGAAQNIPGAF